MGFPWDLETPKTHGIPPDIFVVVVIKKTLLVQNIIPKVNCPLGESSFPSQCQGFQNKEAGSRFNHLFSFIWAHFGKIFKRFYVIQATTHTRGQQATPRHCSTRAQHAYNCTGRLLLLPCTSIINSGATKSQALIVPGDSVIEEWQID